MAIRNKFINNCLLSNRLFAIQIKIATADVECINSLKHSRFQTENEYFKRKALKHRMSEKWKTKKRRNWITGDNEIKAATTAGTTNLCSRDFELFLSSLQSYIIVSF